MKKSQISVEFLFAIGAVITIFLLIMPFSIERRTEISETEDFLDLRNECEKLSNIITAVFISGDGTILNTAINQNVSVNANLRELSIKDKGFYIYCSIPINAVSNLTDNSFTVLKGAISLENINNTVIIKNATGVSLPPTPPQCSAFSNCQSCIDNGCTWCDSSKICMNKGSCSWLTCFLNECYATSCPCYTYTTCSGCMANNCKWCDNPKWGTNCDDSCSTGLFGNCRDSTCYPPGKC